MKVVLTSQITVYVYVYYAIHVDKQWFLADAIFNY